MPCILIVFLGTIFRFLRQNRYWNCSLLLSLVYCTVFLQELCFTCFTGAFFVLCYCCSCGTFYFSSKYSWSQAAQVMDLCGVQARQKNSIGKIRKIVVWIVAGVLFDSSMGVLLNAHDDNIALCSQYLICFRNYWRFSCATSTWLILWCKLLIFETGCTLKTRS